MSFAEVSATSQQSYKYNGKELNTEREDIFIIILHGIWTLYWGFILCIPEE